VATQETGKNLHFSLSATLTLRPVISSTQLAAHFVSLLLTYQYLESSFSASVRESRTSDGQSEWQTNAQIGQEPTKAN
jgi:hypothetical protein